VVNDGSRDGTARVAGKSGKDPQSSVQSRHRRRDAGWLPLCSKTGI
jgi:hypothetical protein